MTQLSALILAWLLSACAQTPTPHFYQLVALSPATPAVPTTAKPLSIGVGPVTLPSLSDREEMVTLGTGNTVDIAPFQRWAAPLKANIVQVLQQNMARQLPNDLLRSYPWSAFGDVDQHIVIEIIRFDALLGNTVTLEANWAVMDDATRQLLKSGHTLISLALPDASYAAAALAFSQALQRMGTELATAIKATNAR